MTATSPHQVPTVDPAAAVQFLDRLHPDGPDGPLSFFTATPGPDGVQSVEWADTTDEAAGIVARLGDTRHVWVGVATRTRVLPGGARGGAGDCRSIPGLWLDIDYGTDGHQAAGLPPDEAAAWDLIDRFPLPPTLVVHTGNGLHPYWLFPAPAEVDDEVRRVLDAWHANWVRLAAMTGWRIDKVNDVPRVMRLPGTLNHKNSPPAPVTVVADEGHRWTLDDIEGHLLPPEPVDAHQRPPRAAGGHPAAGDDTRPGDRYNAEHTCSDPLTAAGWTLVKTLGDGTQHWRHPTATNDKSGTVYPDGRFCCWTSTVPPLQPRAVYQPFTLHALLAHGGDFSAAARALACPGRPRSTSTSTSTAAGPGADGGAGPAGDGVARKYIDRDHGLQVLTLADRILEDGPIRPGDDGRLWAWLDGYWQPVGADEVRRRCREALAQRFRTSHAATMLEWFKAEPGLDTNAHDFDTINCLSGLLNWRTGELRPHTPDHNSTTQIPVRWCPNATCPRIDRFLDEVLEADALDFFWEVVGYLLAAGNPFHKALLLYGSGRNGKGTVLRLIERVLGTRNIAHVTPHQLADNRFAASSLYGKLANLAGDLEARLIERTDTFKMLTGGDTIAAEYKFGAIFNFRCWATFVFSANEAPAVQDHSEGFYSRWLVVPFPRTIPDESRLPEHQLDAELHRPHELEGLFVKAVSALQQLMDRGRFDPPESVLAATGQFRRDTDPIAQFLEEETVLDPDEWIPRSDVARRYRAWCDEAGRRPVASSRLYNRVEVLPGVEQFITRGERRFRGIRLRKEGEDTPHRPRVQITPAPPAPQPEPVTRGNTEGGAGGAGESHSKHVRVGIGIGGAAPPAPPAPSAPTDPPRSGHGWISRRPPNPDDEDDQEPAAPPGATATTTTDEDDW